MDMVPGNRMSAYHTVGIAKFQCDPSRASFSENVLFSVVKMPDFYRVFQEYVRGQVGLFIIFHLEVTLNKCHLLT